MILCGIDEAGRGPLAGPVSAAAVILPDTFPIEILNDSKKLSEKKRAEAALVIKQRALAWGIGWVWQDEIDRINILQASLLAMRRAYEDIYLRNQNAVCADAAIIDGIYVPDIAITCEARPRADALFPAVMAASILAKTERDRVMIEFSQSYPEYGYEKHKGYPTAAHIAICRRIGPSPIQRLSFKY